ncbi:class I SAM-dependent methyltransferase [Aneurinibacillus aneurinilyticus]|uniref:class I SAM-dependent methyltransferase n=1 Tax=Aneurinibacillus aneurinilyticus TaxID=1391 RepID=UPI003672CBDA
MRASAMWIANWEACELNSRTKQDEKEEAYWQSHAPMYDVRNPLAPFAIPIIEQITYHLHSTDHLLEIGAGTGGFTRLLAPYVQRITVIEPSEAMRIQLQNNWQEEHSASLDVLACKWEEAGNISCDVIFAANAFYRMRDMKECIIRMNETACKSVFLIQSIGKPYASPIIVKRGASTEQMERAHLISHILDEIGIVHEFISYPIVRKDGGKHEVALISWNVELNDSTE